MKKIIRNILSGKCFIDRPIVLVDIGASGFLNPLWEDISPFSIAIVCEADDRDFNYQVKSKWKKIISIGKIIVDEKVNEKEFYLTRSPYCSSTLKPDQESLNNFAFADLFKVTDTKMLPATSLPGILESNKIDYVDWFKTDSQGIDLRLFKSLGQKISKKVLIAEFEPGIIDAYHDEDKLHQVLSYFDENFWLSELEIKGSQRINIDLYRKYFTNRKIENIQFVQKNSPGWANVTYLNTMKNKSFDKRDYLLICVFAIIMKQYGFLLEISEKGENQFGDVLFGQLKKYAIKKLSVSPGQILLAKLYRKIRKIFRNAHL